MLVFRGEKREYLRCAARITMSENHHPRTQYFWWNQYCAKNEQIFGLLQNAKIITLPTRAFPANYLSWLQSLIYKQPLFYAHF